MQVIKLPATGNVNEENASLCSVQMKLDSIESSLEKFAKAHNESMSKNHDRLMSKYDVSKKKLDEMKLIVGGRITGFEIPQSDNNHGV